MDVRSTEEFIKKREILLKKREDEELSAINIISTMRNTEEARKELYGDSKIGSLGLTYILVGCSMLLSAYSSTRAFEKHFPRGYKFIGESYVVKVIVILLSARIGITIEQDYFESYLNPINYKEYLSRYNYTELLLQKRLNRLSYLERFNLATGVDINSYSNKIKSLYTGTKNS